MFLLDPVNAVTSVQFYRKVAVQSVGRSLGYLGYLACVFAVATTLSAKVNITPHVVELMDWMAGNVPPITFKDGRITTPTVAGPVTVRHPKFPEFGIMIDASRVEPVTLQMFQENKLVAFLTGDKAYFLKQAGVMEVKEFPPTKGGPPFEMNADFFRQFARTFPPIMYAVVLLMSFPIFVVWKGLATLLYSLMALMISAAMDGRLPYGSLFNISLYAQTLVVALQCILLFSPAKPPLQALINAAIIGTYIALAVKSIKEAGAQASPPAA